MSKKWSEKELLIKLIRSNKYTNPEIAKIIGRGVNEVQNKACRLGMKNHTYRNRITKHKHLRMKVMKFYSKHNFKETSAKFKLTKSELKSLIAVCYRDPKYNHLRKDTRCKRPWTLKDYLFLIQNAGIRERRWISKKLGRGGVHAVKDRISKMNSRSRYMNGLPERLASILLSRYVEGIKTSACAPGPNNNCHQKLVAWVELNRLIKQTKNDVPEHLARAVSAMAKFQKFIHQAKTNKEVIENINKSLRMRGTYEKRSSKKR